MWINNGFVSFNKLKMIKKDYISGNKDRKSLKASIRR